MTANVVKNTLNSCFIATIFKLSYFLMTCYSAKPIHKFIDNEMTFLWGIFNREKELIR